MHNLLLANWFFPGAYAAVFFLAAAWFIWGKRPGWLRPAAYAIVFMRLAYGFFYAFAQYNLWHKDAFTVLLLSQPTDAKLLPWYFQPIASVFAGEGGYFLFYVWGRFFLFNLVSLLAAVLVFWLFGLLRKYRESLVSREEQLFACLAALTIGWPGVVVFLAAYFIFQACFGVINMWLSRKSHTPAAAALFLAAVAGLIFAWFFAAESGLKVLRL